LQRKQLGAPHTKEHESPSEFNPAVKKCASDGGKESGRVDVEGDKGRLQTLLRELEFAGGRHRSRSYH